MRELRKRILCGIIAVIVLFMGMNIEKMMEQSSFFRASETKDTYLSSICYVAEDTVFCTPTMLIGNYMPAVRMNSVPSTWKWNRVVPLTSILSTFWQYRFLYQKAECKEDAQLFLCRSVIVDYIHNKDSGA